MIPLEILTVCLSGSMHTSLAALFAGVFVSMELRHFVCISDATDLFGFLAVVPYILRASGPFVTVFAFACILVLCPVILWLVVLFLFRAEVVGPGAGFSSCLAASCPFSCDFLSKVALSWITHRIKASCGIVSDRSPLE